MPRKTTMPGPPDLTVSNPADHPKFPPKADGTPARKGARFSPEERPALQRWHSTLVPIHRHPEFPLRGAMPALPRDDARNQEIADYLGRTPDEVWANIHPWCAGCQAKRCPYGGQWTLSDEERKDRHKLRRQDLNRKHRKDKNRKTGKARKRVAKSTRVSNARLLKAIQSLASVADKILANQK